MEETRQHVLTALGAALLGIGATGTLAVAATDYLPRRWHYSVLVVSAALVAWAALIFFHLLAPRLANSRIAGPFRSPAVWKRFANWYFVPPPSAPAPRYSAWAEKHSMDSVLIYLQRDDEGKGVPEFVSCEVTQGIGSYDADSGLCSTGEQEKVWVKYPFDDSSIGWSTYFFYWKDKDGNGITSGTFLSPKGNLPSLREMRGY